MCILHLGSFLTRQIFELLPDFQGQYVLVEDQPRLSREIFPRKVRKRPTVFIKKMEQRAIPLRCVINSNAKLLSNWELLLWDAENSTRLDVG